MKKNRKIMFMAHFHQEDTNCYSPKDGHYLDFLSFNDMRLFIDNQEGRPKYLSYSSYDDCFVVHVSYAFSYHTDKYENEYANLLLNDTYKKEEKKRKQIREKQGYVHTYNNPLPLKDLWGKLPKQIILDNLEYLSSGTAWGYFGAIERMFKHDEWLAELYDSADENMKKRISNFLNHSSARHFMDGVDSDMTKEEFIVGFKKYMSYVDIE